MCTWSEAGSGDTVAACGSLSRVLVSDFRLQSINNKQTCRNMKTCVLWVCGSCVCRENGGNESVNANHISCFSTSEVQMRTFLLNLFDRLGFILFQKVYINTA